MKIEAADTSASPYRGPRSYEARDARLFHGRDDEAGRLAALALGNTFTLLHAPSGAGKSSLLSARLMTDIEARGSWVAVRALPRFDPVSEIKAATITRVFPPAESEVSAIDAFLAAYDTEAAREHCPDDLRIDLFTPLAEVKRRYGELARRVSEATTPEQARALQEILHDALTPVTAEDVFPGLNGAIETTPVFQRFIFTPSGERLLASHLSAAGGWSSRVAGGDLPDLFSLGGADADRPLVERLERVMLGALREFFTLNQIGVVARAFRDSCYVPAEPLVDFFERLGAHWVMSAADRDSQETLRILLILDQFEELFTRFRKDELLRRRHAYFRELRDLYIGADPHRATPRSGRRLAPAHVLISMRSDHIAELDGVPEIARHLDQRFRLGFIKLTDAPTVISKPATDFGYRYTDECRLRIIEELRPVSRGDDEIEPQHLQIVCERLWGKFGRASGDNHRVEVTAADLDQLGGARGVFRDHVRHALAGIHEDDEFARFELLNLLEPLITLGGRRNLVGEEELVSAPFRDAEMRARMLQQLARAGLVRIQPRLGEKNNFAEITHEILIQPINDEISAGIRRNPNLRALQEALARAEALQSRPSEAQGDAPFTDAQLRALEPVWDRLKAPPNLVVAAYRGAVGNGFSGDALLAWARRLDASPAPSVDVADDLLAELAARQTDQRYFDQFELDAIARSAERTDAEAEAFLVESAIQSNASHTWLWTFVRGTQP
jgi:hypothetical protein